MALIGFMAFIALMSLKASSADAPLCGMPATARAAAGQSKGQRNGQREGHSKRPEKSPSYDGL